MVNDNLVLVDESINIDYLLFVLDWFFILRWFWVIGYGFVRYMIVGIFFIKKLLIKGCGVIFIV